MYGKKLKMGIQVTRVEDLLQVGSELAIIGLQMAYNLNTVDYLLQVGSEVARRARGLGMICIAHDPFASEAKAAAIGVRLVSLNDALAQGDFFSLHMPLTAQTKVMPCPW